MKKKFQLSVHGSRIEVDWDKLELNDEMADDLPAATGEME